MPCLKLQVILVSRVFLFCFAFSVLFSGPIISSDFVFSGEIRRLYIKKVLQDYPSLVSGDVSVSIKNEDILGIFSKGAASFSLVFPHRSSVLGRTAIPCQFLDKKGEVIQEVKVVAEVDAQSLFYQTVRRIKAGTPIQASDVEEISLSLQGRDRRRARHLSDIVGQVARTSIVAETVLFSYMLDDIPDIKKGSPVRVIIYKNDFELKIKGHVLEDGNVGDTIRVRTQLKSNKVLYGEVIDEQTIRYNFID
jgi:flagella basal body P-ring formation protein FlgA